MKYLPDYACCVGDVPFVTERALYALDRALTAAIVIELLLVMTSGENIVACCNAQSKLWESAPRNPGQAKCEFNMIGARILLDQRYFKFGGGREQSGGGEK